MDKKKILLKDIAKVDPFKTPEGYFENFTNGIMSQLPDVVREDSLINVNWWQRVRPWVYMAAMFTGIALMIHIFVGSPTETKKYALEGLKLSSAADIDDFYHYYDDGLARLAYDDTFYLADEADSSSK
ncbi:MAG: hypothetical protein FWF53_09815 [Candidatus Azobacteroides sp.]|nr:hypothetical protein [Candidatus Azobacteroides sp.]